MDNGSQTATPQADGDSVVDLMAELQRSLYEAHTPVEHLEIALNTLSEAPVGVLGTVALSSTQAAAIRFRINAAICTFTKDAAFTGPEAAAELARPEYEEVRASRPPDAQPTIASSTPAGREAERESASENVRNALQVLRTAGVATLGTDVAFDRETITAIDARLARAVQQLDGNVGLQGDTAATLCFNGYEGNRDKDGWVHVFVVDTPMRMPLDPRLDLMNHSPTGFEWGYYGSGPAQLALAICANAVGDTRALRVYESFKARVIAPLAGARWELSRSDVVRLVEIIEGDLAAERAAAAAEVAR